MPPVSKRSLAPNMFDHLVDLLVQILASSNQTKSGLLFVQKFLSKSELTMLSKRIGIALLLKQGYTYEQIMHYLKVSKGTISKISDYLANSDQESQQILNKIIQSKQINHTLNELDYFISRLLPPKGANWKTWRKNLEKRRTESNQPI